MALSLAAPGHDVSVIDDRPETFRTLGSTFNGTTHLGRAIDSRVLTEAGIESADAFVGVTNSDNTNVMSVQLAKQALMSSSASTPASIRFSMVPKPKAVGRRRWLVTQWLRCSTRRART